MHPGFVYMPRGEISEDTLYFEPRVTDTFPRGKDLPSPTIALIVDGDEIFGVGYLTRGQTVTSFERRFSVDYIELRSEPLKTEVVLEEVPSRMRGHVANALMTTGAIPSVSWSTLREILLMDELGPYIRRFDDLDSIRTWQRDLPVRTRSVMEMEKDATGLALSLADINRRELALWSPPQRMMTLFHSWRALKEP